MLPWGTPKFFVCKYTNLSPTLTDWKWPIRLILNQLSIVALLLKISSYRNRIDDETVSKAFVKSIKTPIQKSFFLVLKLAVFTALPLLPANLDKLRSLEGCGMSLTSLYEKHIRRILADITSDALTWTLLTPDRCLLECVLIHAGMLWWRWVWSKWLARRRT